MRTAAITLSLFLLATHRSAVGEPVPAFQPDRLFARATHIAIVEVLPGPEDPGAPAAAAEGRLYAALERRLLGDDLPDRLRLSLPHTYLPFTKGWPLQVGDSLLVFLVRSEGGDWRLADPYYGLFLVAGDDATPATGTRETVLNELRASLSSSDRRVVEAALAALAAFRDTGGLTRVRALSARHDDPELAARVLAYRIKVGDRIDLSEVTALARAEQVPDSLKDEISWSLTQYPQPMPVPQLNDLVLDPTTYPTLRTVAAAILGESGDRTSIPALIAGLSASDLETQYRCIVALSRITGRPGPGYHEFAQDPRPTLEEWRAWWRETQGQGG